MVEFVMRRVAAVILLAVCLVVPVYAQELPPAPAFVAYQCRFQPQTNSVEIHAVLRNSGGTAMSPQTYTVSGIENATPVLPRSPLQMVIVLDITDTVPIEQIVDAISINLTPRLQVQDEVALITFSEEVSPPTQFYTDKNRLVNEHMIDLNALEGENHLYDAILSSLSAFPLGSDSRKVVLVLTDSGRRDAQQASSQEIVDIAGRSKIEIYPIGFYSRDKPDEGELQTLANGTGGFAWLYTEERNSRATIGAAVNNFLDDFVRALDSEIVLSADMQGQTPDASGQVLLNITVTPNSDPVLADSINCPLEVLHHGINFVQMPDNLVVSGRAGVAISVDTPINPDELLVIFRANDEIVQNSTNSTYTFNAAEVAPGYYSIDAQLWNRNNETLATTPTTIRIYAQQVLQLGTASGLTQALEGVTQFEASHNPAFALPEARFTVTSVADPTQIFDLGRAIFQPDGKAILRLDDVYTTMKVLFPTMTDASQFRVAAFVPGVSPDDANLAFSNDLVISVKQPGQAAAPTAIPPVQAAVVRPAAPDWTLPIALVVLFGVANILLFRWAGRRRILRIINNPDDHELSPQVMTVTVHRGDTRRPHTLTKKTVFIGRGSSNDINLGDDPNISRQHGVIMWRRRGWYYSNRKGSVAARINGKRYRGFVFYKLEPVTEIEIGATLLLFHSSAQQDVSDFIKTNL
jgi:von Willebrand factor type A domain/Inner membrane component of T3SS, cytoplasmic domain